MLLSNTIRCQYKNSCHVNSCTQPLNCSVWKPQCLNRGRLKPSSQPCAQLSTTSPGPDSTFQIVDANGAIQCRVTHRVRITSIPAECVAYTLSSTETRFYQLLRCHAPASERVSSAQPLQPTACIYDPVVMLRDGALRFKIKLRGGVYKSAAYLATASTSSSRRVTPRHATPRRVGSWRSWQTDRVHSTSEQFLHTDHCTVHAY